MQTLLRTSPYAPAAAYALGGTGYLVDEETYRARLFTGPASDAPLLLPSNLHQAETVEAPVNSTQRT